MTSAADAQPDNSPKIAPDYGHHRKDVGTVDVIANAVRNHGINMGAYRLVNIQVVPGPTSNPTATVYWWSEAASAFVQEHTPITRAGLGVGVPYEFTVDANGRIMYVALTGTINGGANAVNVHVSGYELDHTL